ncbi:MULTISPECIES: VanZ family protein [unclassified Polaromonas]|uniref:VanZ family protein n=1 Tax=unclassified Polaromonas TaxID=2638319 RepID=UPI000F08C4F0|nr:MULTISPECIES: VanZ family protein [unclassified Polaromonas]AYQ30195.1 teicoplanin resistance protein VanZ [Polaromonas sp. SP1]QGJ18689.1 teicoplanin resistance protein VanZ [Polaromonas sp. Pch-P]
MVKALLRDNFRDNLQRTIRILAALTVVVSAAVLYVAGAQPVAVGLFPAPWDKLAHLLTFAVVGMAAGLAGGLRGWRMALSCVAGALLVGGMDELHQMFLPGRSASWADLAADAAGGLLGAAVLAVLHRLASGRLTHH